MNESFFIAHKRTIGILIFFLLLISVPLVMIALSNRTDLRQRASNGQIIPEDAVASVGDEFITKAQYDKALGMYSYILKKAIADPQVRQAALNFVTDSRLLLKEAEKRGITQQVGELAETRFAAAKAPHASLEEAEKTWQTDEVTYKSYFLYRTILQELEPLATKWRIVDYLSIRYLWHENPQEEELAFKTVAEGKINEYYNKILSGLDIEEAIRQRCLDPEIDYLPFGENLPVYRETLENGVCREQRINEKVSKDTNPDWGDRFLSEVFKLQDGQLSPIIVYEEPALGMYFIIKVVEDGGGEYFSMKSLISKLRTENNVLTFIQ